MLTLCYLIARCTGGTRLALWQGKVMAEARTNYYKGGSGHCRPWCVGLEEILTWSSRLWGGRVVTDVSDSVLRARPGLAMRNIGPPPLQKDK